MKRILIDVDTQVDFMLPHGSLYVPPHGGAPDEIANILAQSAKEYDAVIGSVDSHAYDAWEFQENGGPFPAHCVKGTPGWLRVNLEYPRKTRFIPMTLVPRDAWNGVDPTILVGENVQGNGSRLLSAKALAREAVGGKVGLYFEKEVYSLFDNPLAEPVLLAIGNELGGDWNKIQIDIIGYCTGGYCVDAAAEGLAHRSGINRSHIRVLAYATAAIGGADGVAKSKQALTQLGRDGIGRGVDWVESP